MEQMSVRKRFQDRVEIVTESGCWLWVGEVNDYGLGSFRINNQLWSTRAASYALHIGDNPSRMRFALTCQTFSCVNPDHLVLATPEYRFWEKVNRGSQDECWTWLGSTYSPKGYGHFHIDGRLVGSHRFSYELEHGPIPDGLHVLHNCDTPSCVNPSHLHLGTNHDNVLEKLQRGRHPRGEDAVNSKLTEADVIRIRALNKQGLSQRKIARMYGVNNITIHNICKGKSWAHVES